MTRSGKANLTRRDVLKTGGALALVAAAGGPPAAAAQGTQFNPAVTPGSPNHEKGWTTILPDLPPGMPLNPPLTITSDRRVDSTVVFLQGDTIDDNPFTRMVKEALGIEWQAAWTWADSDDGSTKLNVSIASNDLPDMLETLGLSEFVQMLEADLIEDITDVWEREASPEFVKQPLEWGGAGRAWSYAEVNGRKMGIPYAGVAAQDDKLLWIRQDWLDKVGMAVPATLDELAAVAKAFVQAELGQGGTTIGLNAAQDLNTWYSSLDPIFGAFGVVPFGSEDFWTPEGEGLMYDGIRPQMQEALALLQQWYADGVIPSDFFIQPTDKTEIFVSGNQCGLHFSPSFAATFGIPSSIENDPEARWIFADVPTGPSGRKGKAWTDPYPQTLFAFRKGFPHVDAVIRQTNWLAELTQVPENRFHGWEGYNYEWQADNTVKTTDAYEMKWFYGPIGTAGNSGTDPLRQVKDNQWLEQLAALPADQLDAMELYLLNDPTGLQTLSRQAYNFAVAHSEEDGIKNMFTALPTETMTTRGSILSALVRETFLGIIKGDRSVDDFDGFVAEWKELGGDTITEEVNEWWSARRG